MKNVLSALENYDKAWKRLSKALEKVGVEIEDQVSNAEHKRVKVSRLTRGDKRKHGEGWKVWISSYLEPMGHERHGMGPFISEYAVTAEGVTKIDRGPNYRY